MPISEAYTRYPRDPHYRLCSGHLSITLSYESPWGCSPGQGLGHCTHVSARQILGAQVSTQPIFDGWSMKRLLDIMFWEIRCRGSAPWTTQETMISYGSPQEAAPEQHLRGPAQIRSTTDCYNSASTEESCLGNMFTPVFDNISCAQISVLGKKKCDFEIKIIFSKSVLS